MNRASRFTLTTFAIIAAATLLAAILFVLVLGGALDGPLAPSD